MMISIIIPVFRDAPNALALIKALQDQAIPDGVDHEIIVVDDGSGDGTADVLRSCTDGNVRVFSLAHNGGRAQARNMGAQFALGEVLTFIDCDCRPTCSDFLLSHWRVIESGCVASCGRVTGDGISFWSRYQTEASERRERQHAQGFHFSGSSQNFSVCRNAFRQCGGFDSRYTTYGFEDRDLFVRLSISGKLGWCRAAAVEHLDPLNLPGVLTKMQSAGGESAAMFAHDHPDAYQGLGYAVIDVRIHPWLRPIAWLANPILRIAPVIDRALEAPWMPYPVARIMVKLMSALAYLRGTSLR